MSNKAIDAMIAQCRQVEGQEVEALDLEDNEDYREEEGGDNGDNNMFATNGDASITQFEGEDLSVREMYVIVLSFVFCLVFRLVLSCLVRGYY